MTRVGVVGGTGYTGVERLLLLAAHPDLEIAAMTRALDKLAMLP